MKKIMSHLFSKLIKVKRNLRTIKRLLLYLIYTINAEVIYLWNKNKQNIKIYSHFIEKDNLDIVFLGKIDDVYINDDVKIDNLIDDLDNPDIVVLSEAVVNNSDKYEKILCISNERLSMVCTDKLSIGFIYVDVDKFDNEKKLLKEIILNKKILKKAGAGFFVAYVRGNATELEKKLIGIIGCDYVIGSDNSVKRIRGYRTLAFNETRVCYSLGSTQKKCKYEEEYYIRKSLIAVRAKIGIIQNKQKVIQEGYIPILASREGKLVKMQYSDSKYADKHLNKRYLHIEKIMQVFGSWENLFTLKDIVNLLEVSLPKKYIELENMSINQICSRTFEIEPGNIFFFRQQFRDNNDKIQREISRTKLAFKAYTRKALFVFSYKKLPKCIPHMVIDDPMEAHIKTVAWYKSKFIKANFIGVTGSIGKTSTKDMIFCALNEKYKTQKNIRNTNVQVKIGLNMQRVSSDCEIYVQEIGGGRPGGASRHSRMIKPIMAVVTNIGTAHIGNYNSQEALMKNKIEIIDGMDKEGILLMNGDDELLWNFNPNCNNIYYAIDNKNADYYAENIEEKNNKTYFDIVHGDKRVNMQINVLGKYNVLNAVCAYAIGNLLGVSDLQVANGILKFKTAGTRQNLVTVNDYKLFLDCFNASVESVATSLGVLEKINTSGKRIAIIGDITGVGTLQEKVNEKIAYHISQYNIDELVCYGKQAKSVLENLKKYDISANTSEILEKEELEKWMIENINKGDVTLFKGSSKSKLGDRVDNVFGINCTDQNYIDEGEVITFHEDNMEYKVFLEHVSIKKYRGIEEKIIIKSRFAGKVVTKLWKKAFSNNEYIRDIELQNGIIHIGSNCFENCLNLERVFVPSSVKYIGKNAFANCKKLKNVVIEGEDVFIGAKAFDGCAKELAVVKKC